MCVKTDKGRGEEHVPIDAAEFRFPRSCIE